MAESLARPWILKYLLGIAETRGANIHDAAPLKEKRKIQITRFLTYPPNDQPNNIIWALISDKQYELPAKFTANAVAAYNRCVHRGRILPSNSLLIWSFACLLRPVAEYQHRIAGNGDDRENEVFGQAEDERRLTTRRFALAVIGDVKAFFARVPLGNGKGMTDTETIALEVGEFRILGADHEGIFGNPTSIEMHEDIQEWVSGLKEGGGGGNILKRPKEEIAEVRPPQAKQQLILPTEKVSSPEKDPLLPKTRHLKVPTIFSESNMKKKTMAQLLKEYNRYWKMISRFAHHIHPPPEVQVEHDQILTFGKELSGIRRTVVPKESTRDMGEETLNDEPVQEGAPPKQESTSKKSLVDYCKALHIIPLLVANLVGLNEANVAHTPMSSPLSAQTPTSTQKNAKEPSTPSEWMNSEDERLSPKREGRKEVNEDNSPPVGLPTPRRTSSPGVQLSPEDEGDERMEEIPASDEEGYEENDGNENRSDRSDDSDEEETMGTSYPAPTPAQRRRQESETSHSIAQSGGDSTQHKNSEPNSSDLPPSSSWPSSIPIAAFPYHTSPKSVGRHRESRANEKPRKERDVHLQFDFNSQGKAEDSAPRILVPDSDTSGRTNSQSLSQSQSQSQSQTQSIALLPSQYDSQPHPQTQIPPSRNFHKQVSRLGKVSPSSRMDNESSQEEHVSSSVHSQGGTRVPLSASRSINQPQQIWQSSNDQKDKRRTDRNLQPSKLMQPDSMSEPLAKAPGASANRTQSNGPGRAEQEQLSSSVTQEDSQQSRTQESSLGQIESSNADRQNVDEPETLASLDVGHARTQRLLFGEQAKSARASEDNGPEELGRRSSQQNVREAYRLSHIQGSPTTHLSKHPRSSSPFRAMNSVVGDDEDVQARKKVRASSPTEAETKESVDQRGLHDKETWRAPTFLQRREANHNQAMSRGTDKGEQQHSVTSKDKGKQRAEVASDRVRGPIISSALSSAAISDAVEKAQHLDPLVGVLRSNTTSQDSSELRKKKTKRRARASPSEATSSQVNLEDSDEYPVGRLLGGYSVDYTSRTEGEGPQWLTLAEAMGILYHLNEKDRRKDASLQ
ncbi:hypothetical protein ACEPAF_7728 [Sanghuangporus sanghuang]